MSKLTREQQIADLKERIAQLQANLKNSAGCVCYASTNIEIGRLIRKLEKLEAAE